MIPDQLPATVAVEREERGSTRSNPLSAENKRPHGDPTELDVNNRPNSLTQMRMTSPAATSGEITRPIIPACFQ